MSRLLPGACFGLLAACSAAEPPMSAAEWSMMQTALGTNPQARESFERACLVDEDLWRDPAASQALAVFLDVEEGDVERITCQRLTAAFARGDFDYDDYVAMNRDPPDTATMRRLFRALRRQPGQIES